MSVIETGLQKISSKYLKDGGNWNHNYYRVANDNGRFLDTIFLKDEIEEYLFNSADVKDYRIDNSTMCDDCGFSCGYISVAWLEKDCSLHTKNLEWYSN